MSRRSVDGQRAQRPAGYPSEFERQVTLQDGRIVDVRPVVPDDAAELREAINTADADTVSRRFLGGPPSVTPALLEYLTVLDYRTRFGLVARDRLTGRGVGIARYEQVGDGAAEVAVVVRPEWRRVGLATALVHLLAEAALVRGISTFAASFLTDNHPVAALLADAGVGAAGFIADGIAEVQIPLAGPPTPPDRRTNPPRSTL